MSEIPFHQTRTGQIFYEGTMPRLVRELARLNENLERLAQLTNRPAADSTQRMPDDKGGRLVERTNQPSGAAAPPAPVGKEAKPKT